MCYGAITTEPIETLFFEDMSQTDYMMIDKDEVTPEHVLIVMKTLAKFHAISFALKDQEPEKFAEILNGLNEIFFVRGENAIFADQINYAQTIAFNCITDDCDTHIIKALMRLYETNQYDLIAELGKLNWIYFTFLYLYFDVMSNFTYVQLMGTKVNPIRWCYMVTCGLIILCSNMMRRKRICKAFALSIGK